MEKLCIIIELNGRVYKQQVTLEEFKELYEPKGWRVDEREFKSNLEIINYNRMVTTQKKDQKFDDNLFKKGN